MRRDISFSSKGLRCNGWLYVPDNLPAGTRAPAIIMAPGFSGTIGRPGFSTLCEHFANNGFVTMAFDFRYSGRSEGEPRQHVLWYEQTDDYHNAITWLSEQPQVDPDRIGLWGTSYSGRHAIFVAAYDKRVKAIACQAIVPSNTWIDILNMAGPDDFNKILDVINRDRIQRQKTAAVNYMPIVAPKGEPCAIPDPKFSADIKARNVPDEANRVTIESVEKFLEYDVTAPLQHLSIPILAVLPSGDSMGNVEVSKKIIEQAPGIKSVIILPCGHFDLYAKEPWFSKTAAAETDWFKKYL